MSDDPKEEDFQEDVPQEHFSSFPGGKPEEEKPASEILDLSFATIRDLTNELGKRLNTFVVYGIKKMNGPHGNHWCYHHKGYLFEVKGLLKDAMNYLEGFGSDIDMITGSSDRNPEPEDDEDEDDDIK